MFLLLRIQLRSVRILALKEIPIRALLHSHLAQIIGPLILHLLPSFQIAHPGPRIMCRLHRPVEAVEGLLIEIEVVAHRLLPCGRGTWDACDIACGLLERRRYTVAERLDYITLLEVNRLPTGSLRSLTAGLPSLQECFLIREPAVPF